MIPKISLKLNNDVLLTVINLLEQNHTFLVNKITDALVLSCQEELIVLLQNKAKSVQKQVSILDHNKKHSITLKFHLGYSLLKLLETSFQETDKKDKKINRIILDLGNKVKLEVLEDHNTEQQVDLYSHEESQSIENTRVENEIVDPEISTSLIPDNVDKVEEIENKTTEQQVEHSLHEESQSIENTLIESEILNPEFATTFTTLTADHFDKIKENTQPIGFDLFQQENDLFTQETAVEETAVEETAVEETAVEETAVEETAVEETAVEETAVEETAVEETAVEETAVEETAVEETAVEDFSEFFAVQKQGLPQSFEQIIASTNEAPGKTKVTKQNKLQETKKKQAKDKNSGQISLF